MRDKKRIDTFMKEISSLWAANFPDWRFGQLIFNFWQWLNKDIFFLEEDEFLTKFKKFVEENKSRELTKSEKIEIINMVGVRDEQVTKRTQHILMQIWDIKEDELMMKGKNK